MRDWRHIPIRNPTPAMGVLTSHIVPIERVYACASAARWTGSCAPASVCYYIAKAYGEKLTEINGIWRTICVRADGEVSMVRFGILATRLRSSCTHEDEQSMPGSWVTETTRDLRWR